MDEKQAKYNAIWQEYLNIASKFKQVRKKLFLECGYDKGDLIVELVKKSLYEPEEKVFALEIAEALTKEAQKELFDYLFPLAIELETKSTVNKAEKIILSLPKDWLINKLREQADIILKQTTPDITSGLLMLYFEVDKETTKKLTLKALENNEPYSQDIGRFFLKKLEETL